MLNPIYCSVFSFKNLLGNSGQKLFHFFARIGGVSVDCRQKADEKSAWFFLSFILCTFSILLNVISTEIFLKNVTQSFLNWKTEKLQVSRLKKKHYKNSFFLWARKTEAWKTFFKASCLQPQLWEFQSAVNYLN